MRVRLKTNPNITGYSDSWNTFGASEILVTYDEGDASSEYYTDYEVLIGESWFPMDYAFSNHMIISNNENDKFREPKDDKERARGYYY